MAGKQGACGLLRFPASPLELILRQPTTGTTDRAWRPVSGGVSMVSRLERTPFAAWWFTIDRMLLAALLALMLGGIVLSLAASPPVASRLGLEPFYFVSRHVFYLITALAVLLATSFLPPRHIRRLALIIFVLSLLLIAATLQFGAEVKGARRWIVLAGINIQPSEFLKPTFVILIAWLFGESARRPEMPANT